MHMSINTVHNRLLITLTLILDTWQYCQTFVYTIQTHRQHPPHYTHFIFVEFTHIHKDV